MAYVSRYPILDIEHVGATSMRSVMHEVDGGIIEEQAYYPYYAFDSSKSLIGSAIENSWASLEGERVNQRIWVDLSIGYVISRLYYENYHDANDGSILTRSMNDGAYMGSIWGSNIRPGAYGNYSGCTLLWEYSISDLFVRHSSNNIADPHYITFSNSVAFRYYIIDIINNYSGNNGIGFRRLEFQEDV